MSIKTKILLTKIITVLLAVLILGSLGYRLMVRALLEVQREKLEFVTASTVRDLDRYLRGAKENLQEIARGEASPGAGERLPPGRFAEYGQIFPCLVFLDRDGMEDLKVVRGRVVPDRRSWKNSPLLQRSRAYPGQIVISPLSTSPELGETVLYLALSSPPGAGGATGTLLAAVPLSTLAKRLPGGSVGRSGFVGLVTADAGYLLRDKDESTLQPVGAAGGEDERFRKDLETLRGGFTRTALLGTDSFVAYAPLEVRGWEVVATLPYREFMTHPNRLKLLSLLFCAIILSAGLLSSTLVARKLTRSIGQMIRHTEYVSAGDFTRTLRISTADEMETLARSFNAMTERLRRTTCAKESLHNIVQSILDPLVVAGGDGRITGANPSAEKLFGYSESELKDMPLAALFPDGEPIFRGCGFRRVLESGPIRNYETKVRTRTGQMVPVLFSCSLTAPEENGSTGMVGILKDITDRREAELARLRALREAEEARDKIDAILTSVTDGLVVTGPEGRITLMNPAAEELLGTPLVEAWNRAVSDVIQEETLRDHLLAQMRGEKSPPLDLEIFDHRRQEMRVFQTRTSPVQSRDRLTTGLITTLRDVTHERQVDRLKNEFISTAAHELRTPLTSIMGYSEFLLYPEEFGGFDPEQQREFLAEIFEKAEVLSKIVNELLDISRIEAGQTMPLDRTRCRVGETVARVLRNFRLHCPDHQFELSVSDPTAEIWVDQGKFVQVVENLLSNAVKYSPGGGPVRLGARLEGDRVHISVEDRGIGMTSDQAARIFDKFYRADSSNTAIGGLGLGMSIAKSIIAAHGGTISVESAPGIGTTVTFTLPVDAESPFSENVQEEVPFSASVGA